MSEFADLESKFRRLAELRETRDTDKAALERSEAEYREYESELFQTLEESSVKGSLGFDFGGDLGTIKFQPRATVYGRVIDKVAARDALEALGIDEEIMSQKVEARRLNDLVREYRDQGKDLPDGIDFYEKKFITVSRKRGG